MNVIAWARVSSREQKGGYSLDAQMRAIREKAQREGLKIVREFTVAESAKRNADRAEFEKMLTWVRHNAKRENLRGIICHKLDRACRNMRDVVRLQEMEDLHGVRPMFVDNQFGQGAAGQLSFNVMAAVAQYYSDNLRSEVLKGMNEKVEQGWLPANAPFGYQNLTDDLSEPI
jgi:site-specific DNA recombinase